ncbi:hypothetical protein PMIN02_010176 [Paraphaeosphaeria minitans]
MPQIGLLTHLKADPVRFLNLKTLPLPSTLAFADHEELNRLQLLSMHIRSEIQDDTSCRLGGSWYKCAETLHMAAYAGCCTVPACDGGCPEGHDRTPPRSNGTLSAGTSSTLDLAISPTSPLAHVATIVTVSAGHTFHTTVTEYSTPTSQSTSGPVPTDQNSGNRKHVGAIVGGTVGGVVLMAAAIFLILLLRRRRRTKEERRATLPPTYPIIRGGEDMSEHLTGTPSSSAGTKNIAGNSSHTSSESVPQLDGIAIIPPNEIGSDALGTIPELPANEKDPFETPRTSEVAEISQEGNVYGVRACSDPDNHVMSWANIHSMGNRSAMSRLSRPHTIPEGGVWENIIPTKKM